MVHQVWVSCSQPSLQTRNNYSRVVVNADHHTTFRNVDAESKLKNRWKIVQRFGSLHVQPIG